MLLTPPSTPETKDPSTQARSQRQERNLRLWRSCQAQMHRQLLLHEYTQEQIDRWLYCDTMLTRSDRSIDQQKHWRWRSSNERERERERERLVFKTTLMRRDPHLSSGVCSPVGVAV